MLSTIGHAAALDVLRRALDSGHPHHAWIFIGPEGIGKAHVALEFAAALNCTGEVTPCGECRACLDTLAQRHADLELVAPGGICDEPDHREHSDSRDLRICQVRRIEHLLALSPYAGRRRIAIVDAADTLRVEAANAFLKTLEEPPADSVIILLAERPERLPETIISRCQRLNFRLIERSMIVKVLTERGAAPEQAEAIAAAAGGRLGWALRALEDETMLQERDEMLTEAVRLAHAGRAERFAWAKDAAGRDGAIRERYLREIGVWESWWRDILLFGAGGEAGASHPDKAATLREECRLYAATDVLAFLRSLAQTREHLYANVDAQLALENLTLDLPSAVRSGNKAGATVRPAR